MTLARWDALYVVVVGSVVGFLLVDRAPGVVSAPAAAVLLALGLAWHVLHGRLGFPVWVFAGVLALLHLTAVWLDHTASFALIAWASMLFAALPLRPALAVVAALDLLPVPLTLVRDGTLAKVHGLIPLTVLGLAFAVVAGTYIARLTDQNEERAAMIAELSASRAEVARLSHEAGVLTERARLAAEIHDTLAQGFTSIITLTQAASGDPSQTAHRLAQVTRTARENLAEARALVAALSPADLQTSGLGDAVRRQLSRLASETGIHTACHFDHRIDDALAALPTAVQVVLLRSLQEALTNVRKHAHAATVDVRLSFRDGSIVLTVTDDGLGFTPPLPAPTAASRPFSESGPASGSGSAAESGSGSVSGSGFGSGSGSGSGFGAASGSGAGSGSGSGVGSGSGSEPSVRSGFGLAGMRARVEQAGGVCTVSSRSGTGTTVTVQLG
ncbi:sensor histidine kinase [Dactylosporangium sp. NPDC005555]|uniref:sensor histidine kinase n=1 Tax=Dactylosporangium sp. NPDC005555 TaxID=3154889 RepID=UPI0033ABFF7C